MVDLEKLHEQLKFHLQKVAEHQDIADKLTIAIEVLEKLRKTGSITELMNSNLAKHEQSLSPDAKNEQPKEFNPDWTHFKKVAYFINSFNRFVFPSEIEMLYRKHGLSTDDGIVNQTLLSMKTKGILTSYKPTDFVTRAHAWGKPEWMGANNKPLDKYKALEIKKDIWAL